MYITKIETIHLEWTSYCNARCPQCSRTDNKELPLKLIALDDIKQWFTPEVLETVTHVYNCGNYGDAATHPECIQIIDWFLNNGCNSVALHSNGGLRDTEFWSELGKRNIRVVFGIDGLEDTNHIYRVGVIWHRLMSNVKAFIAAGGRAEWAYLVFAHNEHQIDDARKLATELGFRKFTAKASSRFTQYKDKSEIKISVDELKNRTIINKNQQAVVPAMTSLTNHDQQYLKVLDQYGNFDNYVKQTVISCKTQKENALYIDFLGKVWPCCWLGHLYRQDNKPTPTKAIVEKYGETFNSLYHHNFTEIMEHEWFMSELENSWNDASKRLLTCSEICGKEYSASSLQIMGVEWLQKN